VNALGLVGMTCDEAGVVLEENDLVADCQTGNAAPTEAEQGIIYAVNPTGRVEPGTPITLTAYGAQVALPPPGNPTLSAATVEPGGTLTVNWPGYTCPAGEGSPSAYNFTTSIGTFPNGQSTSAFGASERNSQITVPANVTSGTVIVTYTVTCTGGPSAERESPASGEATSTVQPVATPTPQPEADDEG
jgi:serine/threonine-protein kinase